MILKDKKVLIIGMARSGISAAKSIKSRGAYVVINDSKSEEHFRESIDEVRPYVDEFIFGQNVSAAELFDLIVLSPGVPPKLEHINQFRRKNIPVIGTLELGYRLVSGKFIGITGTNGKTTTTALTTAIFKNAQKDAYAVGNIGVPITSKDKVATSETYLITEVSSFQLETIEYFKPEISAILNITPDHLNRHETMESYITAKKRIFENQKKHSPLILNFDNSDTRRIGEIVEDQNVIFFSLTQELSKGVFIKEDKIVIKTENDLIEIIPIEDIFLLGDHNIENAMAAVAISFYSGISKMIIAETLRTFQSIEHRIEFVKEVNGIRFYNDSKGTNPESSIKAIEAMDRPTVLIAGGMDKGSEFEAFVDAFDEKITHLVLLGETKEVIEKTARAQEFNAITLVKTMEDAVQVAFEKVPSDGNVLLSPACASWDMYESYEHRGREFKAIVLELED